MNSDASWLCKEAASRAQDNIFYACGHSISDSLMKARDESLENAKREFNKFCNESANCQHQAYIISPLRTDCELIAGKYSCYRGLEYAILPQKRSVIQIDKDEVETIITLKESELSALKDAFNKTQKLERINEDIELLKKADKTEADIEYLKGRITRDYPTSSSHVVGLKVSTLSVPIKYDREVKDEDLGSIGAEYEYLMLKNMSFKFFASYIFGSTDKSKLEQRGPINSTSEKFFYGHQGYDASVSLPLILGKFSIMPQFGLLSMNYKSYQYNYNEYGIGLSEIQDKGTYSSTYLGLGLRFGSAFFIELESRKYVNTGRGGAGVGIGYRVEF